MQKTGLAATALVLLMLLIGFAPVVVADEEAGVTVTVTIKLIAISVDPTTHAFGFMDLSSIENTFSEPNYKFRVQNTGNVGEDFTCRASDTDNWTLEASPGADMFALKVSDAYSSETGAEGTYTVLTTTAASWTEDVAANDNMWADLLIETPTSTVSYEEQTTTATFGAVTA